jgi:hypothetical protein
MGWIVESDDWGPGPNILAEAVRPGDSLWLWRFDELCRDDNSLAHGKVPDERGRVPKGGAY